MPSFTRPQLGASIRPVLFSVLALAACDPGTKPETPDGPTGPSDPGVPGETLCRVDVQCPGSILDNPKAPCTMQVADSDGAPLYDGAAGLELRGRSSLT